MTTERTRHPATCWRCQGTGRYAIHPSSLLARPGETFPCDHTFAASVTGPDEDELRIAQLEDRNRELESKLSQCAATCEEEARRAREGALEEACAIADDFLRRLRNAAECFGESYTTSVRISDMEGLRNDIAALKGKA